MNTNCTRCDKPNCPYRAARDAFDSYPRNRAVDGNPEWEAITETMWYASGVCESNKVNWRDRCLAAEAELAKLRAYMPKWRRDSAGGFTLGFSVTTLASVIDSRGLWFATVMHRRVDEPLPARDEAMRAVEKVLRLPVCEVLP